MADKKMEAQISVEFEEATSRQSLNSGERINILWSKVKRWLSDLKAVAFSGSYSDLSDTPTTATTTHDGLMSAVDKTKLDGADDTYALKSKYGDTTINVGRRVNAPIGDYSTSLGIGTVANGYASTAEGAGSQAAGYASHAGGCSCQAIKEGSFAHGYEVYANHDYETAFGKHNVSNDDTLFSIGDGIEINTDGNISIARHNAFEITKTGGKLHDKDIATADMIPTELPANGGNADTVNSLKTDAPNYLDIFSTTLNSSHPCWNKKCSVYGQSNDINAEVYLANAPEIDIAVWYEVETIGNSSRAYQIAHGCYIHQRKSFIRYMHDAVWSDWFEIYTSNSKPYVTGSATVAANNTTCTSNHGFTPSAVIWWDGSLSGVAVSFSDTQFTIDKTSSVGRTINYLMFK